MIFEMMSTDEKYMLHALELASCGECRVSPNPLVGAVVVSGDGTIVGEGYHRAYGGPHAEVHAIGNVRDKSLLPQCTVYVTLEPCAHYGKTPPCAELLINSGVRRVVVATLDPFEKVSGRGVSMLRGAGIEVSVGVLEHEARHLNRRFLTAHLTGMPWVTLKWAQSSDGFIARDDKPCAFSTPLTLTLMHRERARHDAILVGARTVAVDDPSLTTRLWPGRNPLRVVLDENLSMPKEAKLLTDYEARTIVVNATRNATKDNVEWLAMPHSSPREVLEMLYRRGETSVMVEGGAVVLQQFIDAGLWNEARVETAPLALTDGVKAPAIEGRTESRRTVDGNEIAVIVNDKAAKWM